MFGFFKDKGKNRQLEEIMQRLQVNAANNYKDAAQLNLKEYEEALQELKAAGTLKGTQLEYYEEKLQELRIQMKNFTHKDQKPYWVR